MITSESSSTSVPQPMQFYVNEPELYLPSTGQFMYPNEIMCPPQMPMYNQQNMLLMPDMPPLPFPFDMPPQQLPLQQPLLQQQKVAAPSQLSAARPPTHPGAFAFGPPGTVPNTTSANDSCSQISHVLQCYQQGGEDPDFVRKAIESLVKKLKDKRVELDALITAVTSNGKQPTCCVTIQRSLDGRLQVAGRKGVPHVVYARIWRWPNVGKNELQKLPMCCIAPDNQDFICINPYHYERVVSSNIGNIDMATLRLDPVTPATYPKMSQASEMPQTSQAQDSMSFSQLSSGPFCSSSSSDQNTVSAQQPPMAQPFNFEGGYGDWMGGQAVICPQQQQAQTSNNIPGSIFQQNDANRFSKFDLNQVQIPPVAHFPEHWCTVSYYELDTQIGDSFKVLRGHPEVTIDGGLDPQADRNGRLCLGALSNVHRSHESDKTRMHIGAGVVLRQLHDDRVTIECRSLKAIFVRAPFLDFTNRTPYGTAVHKLTNADGQITIFDLRWAYGEMLDQAQNANMVIVAQARAVAGLPMAPQLTNMSDSLAGSGVDEMQRAFCTIALSFVKGWGTGYNRKTIKETPCWIEIQLHRPLQLLDQLLKGSYG